MGKILFILFIFLANASSDELIVESSAFYYQYSSKNEVEVILDRIVKENRGIIILYADHDDGVKASKFLNSTENGRVFRQAFNIILLDKNTLDRDFSFKLTSENKVFLVDASIELLDSNKIDNKNFEMRKKSFLGLLKFERIQVPSRILQACLMAMNSRSFFIQKDDETVLKLNTNDRAKRGEIRERLINENVNSGCVQLAKYLFNSAPEIRLSIWNIISKISELKEPAGAPK